jgi:ubiquinone/menaquinone biosynthesis C-methylase UbiE
MSAITQAAIRSTMSLDAVLPPAVMPSVSVPEYLKTHYWWAYLHPAAVKVFERQWLVNLILWGNYAKLRDAALTALGPDFSGRTLQSACVYGDLTCRLGEHAASAQGDVDVIDVAPIQLRNLSRKLRDGAPVRLLNMDASRLNAEGASYDRALSFFLLHEQPEHVRRGTLAELCRVVKPGGRIIIVDYAAPHRWHPLRYLWRPLLAALEPFALDLWRREIADYLPASVKPRSLRRRSFFGGLYQMIEIER